MKHCFFQLIVLSCLLLGCGKNDLNENDPCYPINCIHGECEDGTCDCEPGYGGEDCSILLVPKSITVNKIQLTGMFNACNDWDPDNDGLLVNDADVFLRILQHETVLWDTREIAIPNTSCSHGCLFSQSLVLQDLQTYIRIEIYDKDEESEELIGSIVLTPWQVLRGKQLPTAYLIFQTPQECVTGLNSNFIPVSVDFRNIQYQF